MRPSLRGKSREIGARGGHRGESGQGPSLKAGVCDILGMNAISVTEGAKPGNGRLSHTHTAGKTTYELLKTRLKHPGSMDADCSYLKQLVIVVFPLLWTSQSHVEKTSSSLFLINTLPPKTPLLCPINQVGRSQVMRSTVKGHFLPLSVCV